MSKGFIDAVKEMQSKMANTPTPQNTTAQIMAAQRALISVLRKNSGAVLSKMTGTGKK